jgi:hypothetical protein
MLNWPRLTRQLQEEEARQKVVIDQPDGSGYAGGQLGGRRRPARGPSLPIPLARYAPIEGAINNFQAEWPTTLSRRRQLAYEFWEHLKPLGFGLNAQILAYPGGFPGDVGLSLTW